MLLRYMIKITTMKNVLYIFNILMMIIFASINNAQASAMTASNELKIERYAVLSAWFFFGVCLLITYLVWKKKSQTIVRHANKLRTKTYEIIDHGKRIVVTKKLPDSKKSTKNVA
jgi:hypothetical protein